MIPITVWFIFSRIGLVNLVLFYFIKPWMSLLVILGETIYLWNSPYIFEVLLANILAYNLIKVVKFSSYLCYLVNKYVAKIRKFVIHRLTI